MLNCIIIISTIFAIQGENMMIKFDIETYKLKNGLTVFLYEDHTLPIVAVDVNYNVGSKNEVRGKTGFAHLFEHIMFQGSKHFNDDYFKALQDIGGEVNGATNQDRTRYYEIIPSNYLERALWLESDRMGYLLDALTEERLKNQISVVINEYRQNYENRPYGMVYFEMLKLLYPPHHPYSWPTIGIPEDIKNATLEDVRDFFTKYYSVNNATIAIAGDINKEETKRLVEKYFGTFKPAKPVKYLSNWTPRLNETKSVVMKDNVNLPKIYILYPTTAVFEKFDAELDIIAKVLGENENSRLYKLLVKEKKIASEVSAYQSSNQIAGYLVITATLYPDKDFNEARELILKEVKRLTKRGITKDEIEQAKSYFKSEFIRGLKRLGGFGGIADRMNYYYQMLGNPNMFEYDIKRYENASLKSVRDAAEKYLSSNYAEVVVIPEKNIQYNRDEIDRSKMPDGSVEKELNLPLAKRILTSTGYNLYIMPYSRLPLNYISLVIPAGSSKDEKRFGIANFTANMLLTGTKSLTQEEIQSRLDILGSTIDVQTDADIMTITATFLSDKAEETLQLLADILFNPSFGKKEIEILRERYLNTLLRLTDQLPFVAQATIIKQYFKDNPYGHLSIGDIEFLKSVDREEIVKFYNDHILSNKPILVYTGPFNDGKIKGLIERYISGFKISKNINSTKLERKEAPKGIKIFFANKPHSSQSHIMFAFRGVMRKDEQFESAYTTNTIFGGYFLSRLNMRLREEKGFTYGARSNLRFYLNDSVWTTSTSVQADATKETIKETINVIKEMQKEELLSDDELNKAKGYLIRRFPIEFETIDNIHSKLINIAIYDLPEDSINREYKKLKEISKADVIKISKEYINPENLIIVIVGDREKVFDGLKEISKDITEVSLFGDELH
ncbi:MAG: M16 family metallopeptidase [Myxococcota bacterium]